MLQFVSYTKNKRMPYPYAELTLQERSQLVAKIKKKYPSCRPVLVDMLGKNIPRRKYLVPETVSLSRLLYSIRQENKLNEYEGVFLFVDSCLLSMSQTISEAYSRHANRDGFLYVTIALENTFGEKIQ